MSVQTHVAQLKQHFEQLFPGKWLVEERKSKHILTAVPQVDQSISRGIERQHITEWSGPLSSGKTTLLRTVVTNLCARGLNVAYIDVEGRLLAADWSFVESESGKFWIVRPPAREEASLRSGVAVVPLISSKNIYFQEALWSTEQLIRSNAFDVVILDLGSTSLGGKHRGLGYMPGKNRVYARLQRALDKSRAAMIIVNDNMPAASQKGENAWGCRAKFSFDSSTTIRCEAGLRGVALIVPLVQFTVSVEGISQRLEVGLGSSVSNRLFTHSQVSDRRTSKG